MSFSSEIIDLCKLAETFLYEDFIIRESFQFVSWMKRLYFIFQTFKKASRNSQGHVKVQWAQSATFLMQRKLLRKPNDNN